MNAVCVRRDSFVRTAALCAAVGCLVAPATGCKSGSWGTKPAWMTFGQKAPDVDGLASSPAGAGDVPKPSTIAKPYPTTSTPQGYSLPDAAAQAATAPGSTPAAVTYGSTPPPAAASPAPMAQAAAAPVSPSASIAPQVGPYAPSAAAVPGASSAPPSSSWSSPGLVAVPPAAAEAAAATVSTAPPPWSSPSPAAAPEASPPERFADARAGSPAWTPTPLEPPPADGRYGTSGTSRFSTGTLPAAASFAPPPTPAELPPAVEPAAASPAPSAPAAPLRRPDPEYRPGGTSSYRPVRSSLAGEPPAGVLPTSFQPGQPVAP